MKRRWVLASGNRGKLMEFQRRLAPFDIELVPQVDLGIEEAEETGSSFTENAILKAEHASRESQLPTLADDSGLEVEALHGAPGVRSARYAGLDASDDDNINKLLSEMVGREDRTARFRCVLAFVAEPPAKPVLFQGAWYGEILTERRGVGGFGYDPVFWIPGLKRTAAELDLDTKNQLSHRGQALDKLINALSRGELIRESDA